MRTAGASPPSRTSTLYDENGDEYSYLFWEGENNTDYDFSTGFCVAGADTADFLREKLAEIGLTPRDVQRIYRVLAAENAG